MQDVFEIFLPTQKWELDVPEFCYTWFDVTCPKKSLLENGGMLPIGLKITATTKFSGMEIAQKLGSGLKLRDASVESKISAKFVKNSILPTNENCVQNIKIPKSSKITFCSKLV